MAKKPKPGPEPERLQITGSWKAAVKKALKRERPPEGWPETNAKKTSKKKSAASKKRGRAKA